MTTTTTLSAIKSYIQGYTGLKTGAPVWVDYLGSGPSQYSIVSIPGERVLATYLNGGSLREYPFALQSVESTADEIERLANAGFYEAFADWLESQSLAGVYPTLATGKHAVGISALGGGGLFDQGESGTGIYQIQCKLTYEQDP